MYDDHLPLDYGPLNDHRRRLGDINRTRCRSGDHASCETQKE
jgi:hypothetical protein